MSWSVLAEFDYPISALFLSDREVILAFGNGDVFLADWDKIITTDPSKAREILTLAGSFPGVHIRSIVSDASGFRIVVDDNRRALLKLSGDNIHAVYIEHFETHPLMGPHSVCLARESKKIFFTDSGPRGESGLHRAIGSLFMVNNQGLLIGLCHRTLAYPTSICLSSDESELFVLEKGLNRVLRFYFDKTTNQWEGTLFLQLSGAREPTVIVYHRGNLYISRTGFKENYLSRIEVYDSDGLLRSVIPNLPLHSVSGLLVSSDQTCLIVFGETSNQVWTYPLIS